jgi:hypothetical protein
MAMKGLMMFAALVSVFATGCYDSWADQCEGEECGREDFPVVTCEIAVTTNAMDGATVTVDGVETGTTVELEVGFYTFAASAAGYYSASQTVEVTRECEPVELRLMPNLNGLYDLVLYHTIYDRLILHVVQTGTDVWAEDWYEDRPEFAWQFFNGSISVNGEVVIDLLSDDSVHLHMEGLWTPPRGGGVARIEGTWRAADMSDGIWVAESRP